MKKIMLLITTTILLISGCIELPEEPENSYTAFVYESKNSIQCGDSGLTKAESALKLTNIGVDVTSSVCAYDNLIDVIQACDNPTNEIIVHSIPVASITDAKGVGFYDNPDFSEFNCD